MLVIYNTTGPVACNIALSALGLSMRARRDAILKITKRRLFKLVAFQIIRAIFSHSFLATHRSKIIYSDNVFMR